MYKPKQKKYFYTDTLGGLLKKANDHDYVLIHQHLDHYITEFERVKASGHYNDESIAYNNMILVEQEIDKQKKDPANDKYEIACKKGCSYCCHIPVMITDKEAVILIKHCEEAGIPIDWDLLSRQSAFGVDDWSKNERKDQACTFLNKQSSECTVYKYRPVACRKYFIIGNPIDCDTDRENDLVQIWNAPVAEIIASAALNAFESDMLAKMILKMREHVLRTEE